MRPVSFRHVGGDIYWRTVPISAPDAAAVLDVFLTEYRAAAAVRDQVAFETAMHLADELAEAIHQHDLWRRASGPVSTNIRIGEEL